MSERGPGFPGGGTWAPGATGDWNLGTLEVGAWGGLPIWSDRPLPCQCTHSFSPQFPTSSRVGLNRVSQSFTFSPHQKSRANLGTREGSIETELEDSPPIPVTGALCTGRYGPLPVRRYTCSIPPTCTSLPPTGSDRVHLIDAIHLHSLAVIATVPLHQSYLSISGTCFPTILPPSTPPVPWCRCVSLGVCVCGKSEVHYRAAASVRRWR